MQKVIKVTYVLVGFFCFATATAQNAPANVAPTNPSQALPLPTQKATEKTMPATPNPKAAPSPALPLPTQPNTPNAAPNAPVKPSAPGQNAPASPAASAPVDKKAWMDNMQKGLPGLLCQEEHYFVQCFEVNGQQCSEFANIFVESCLNNANLILPQTLDGRQKQYWGQMIGRCSYDLYEKFMAPKKKAKPECAAPKADANAPQPSSATPSVPGSTAPSSATPPAPATAPLPSGAKPPASGTTPQ